MGKGKRDPRKELAKYRTQDEPRKRRRVYNKVQGSLKEEVFTVPEFTPKSASVQIVATVFSTEKVRELFQGISMKY